MGNCVVYKDRNFTGDRLGVAGNIPNLKTVNRGGWFEDWNDEISSIIIYSGRFRFFEHVDFGGQSWELGPGEYPWVSDQGIFDNCISSIELVPGT